MSRPVVYIATTNHGFGHAVRSASVAASLQQLDPNILIVMATTAPRWLLESYILGDFIYRPRPLDVGVVQADSLQMDLDGTLEKLKQIRSSQHSTIAAEVSFLHLNRVGLILADLPPLAAPLAKAAGIPCWMMGNFGWDFIYRDWGGEFVEIADWIGSCFGQCDRLFRLPLNEPMAAFPHITDVGLTGGTPRHDLDGLRQELQITAPVEKTVLLTFGGLGLDKIPYSNLGNFPDWQFLTFDRHAPSLPNLIRISNPFYRPVDFMPLCGRLISKPGYSTFAEALCLDVPIVSISREGFAESPILLNGLQHYSYHQIITPDEFFEGDWQFLHRPLQPPLSSSSLAKDGTDVIARAVVDFFQENHRR
ncbi:MAG: glycosyl transferase [Geitlerinemataceae cyanobacterium]